MHDIKNLVSQLSLVARNAERHADNPAFRADMVATLQKSVGKMNDLLARLSATPAGRTGTTIAPVDLGGLLRQVVEAKQPAHPGLTLDLDGGSLVVSGDISRLEQLFAHLIQNAIDASAADAPITVTARRVEKSVTIAIADQGKGMSQRFIRNELFTPFKSTKPGGFGIGAYEAREIARAIGGRLDVVSVEQRGTTFTVTLPLARSGAMREAAE
jgi:putative PEP-CTERM system histidine kinase